jgi:hypothetical protein
MHRPKSSLLFIPLFLLQCFLGANAQEPKLPAPIPSQIAAAQKVFISNHGGDSFKTVIDQTVFSGGPDRPYNQFYAAIRSWGKYEVVSAPSDADLIFQIGWHLTGSEMRLDLAQLQLVIIDPKTKTELWTLNEFVRGAHLLSNRDKNFDQAMNMLVTRLKKLVQPQEPMKQP